MKTDRLLAMERKIDLVIDYFGTMSELHMKGVKKEEVEATLRGQSTR